jgi:hypothetical protein
LAPALRRPTKPESTAPPVRVNEECARLGGRQPLLGTITGSADLRAWLNQAARAATVMRQALQEIEPECFRCHVRRGRVCGLHAIVRRPSHGKGDKLTPL